MNEQPPLRAGSTEQLYYSIIGHRTHNDNNNNNIRVMLYYIAHYVVYVRWYAFVHVPVHTAVGMHRRVRFSAVFV
jgi:hypothetical protein